MLREKIFRLKLLSLGVICAFFLLLIPVEALTQTQADTGSMEGFIYGEDMKTPLKDAVVKIRNIKTGIEYHSTPTDETGGYYVTEIEEGRYILGVSTEVGDYSFDYTILIKVNETAKLSLALKPFTAEIVKEKEEVETGSVEGFIYGEDMKTRIRNAVVKIRNIRTGEMYYSTPTDETGRYEITEIEEGRYILGVSTEVGDYSFDYTILIKVNETAKLSLALKPFTAEIVKEEEKEEAAAAAKKVKRCPLGDSYIPEVEGECVSGYKWDKKKKECKCKKKKIFLFPFFLLPSPAAIAGTAVVVAASAAIIYSAVSLATEVPVSPAKKKRR